MNINDQIKSSYQSRHEVTNFVVNIYVVQQLSRMSHDLGTVTVLDF